MSIRVVQFDVRNRAAAAALGVAALVTGGVLLALGITLLAGIAVVGVAVGAGVMLYRSLTGRRGGRLERRVRLDPSMEVFPEPPRDRPSIGPR